MSSRIDRTVPALCLVALLGGLAGAQVPQVRQVRQVRQDIVTGVVIDGRGEPVAGSDVLVLEAAHPGLPEGLEGVIAPSMPRHRRVRADTTGRFSIRLDHGRTATLVADQAERGMSFPLGPIPLGGRAQLVLRPTRVVHGTCRGGAQQALVGLQVRVRVPLPGWSTGSEAFFDIAALTDAEGRYQARVPAGTWVRVEAYRGATRFAATVHDDPRMDLVCEVQQPVRGRVVDEAGKACPGAMVSMDRSGFLRARTDAAGGFALPWRAGDVPTLCAVSPGKAPAVHYVGFGRPPASVVVTARDGVRLRARLVDPTGAALAGARVVLAAYVLDDNPKRHGFHHARWTQRLDRQGRLTALCAASGRSLDVFVEYQQRFHWVHSGPIRRDLDRGTITIGPGLPLTGILSDAVRQPFAAVDVSLVRVPDIEFDAAQLAVVFGTPRRLPALRCQSNSAGRFALPHLHPGRYALLCRGAAHPVLLQIVDLKAAVVDLRVAFPSGGTISGVVRNTDGEPMEGVTVFGRAARDSSNRSFLGWFGVGGMVATTDRRGRYRFLGLPTRERFRLQAHKVGYRDLDAARWNEGTAAVGSLIDFEIRRVE